MQNILNAVLCFDLVDKSPNLDAPVKRHSITCRFTREHRARMERGDPVGTMFWSEVMSAEMAETKGRELADRLEVNYDQCQICANSF